MAPPVYGDEGSMARIPTRRPCARQAPVSALSSVDLPLPGGPVTPTRCAPRPAANSPARRGRTDGSPFSIAVSSRASGRRPPPASPSSAAPGSGTAPRVLPEIARDLPDARPGAEDLGDARLL